jgi:predicted transposase YdaD
MMDEGIAKAQAIMDRISRDEGLLHAYHLYEMTLSDETSMLNGARDEGEAIGWEKGLAEGEARIRETARNLRAMGLSAEQIAAATGLSPGEIAGL